MFVDQAVIAVKAGSGGPGAVSFRREKFAPKGGPDGGNGGDGGSVIAVGDENINTLYDFQGRFHWTARDGERGSGSQCSGLAGGDLQVLMPPGTLVYDADTGELLADLKHGDKVVVAQGGKGGWGNEHFKTSTNQTPRRADPGEPGQERQLRLELKLIAEVGIIGLPNAGKSTLLAALTRATPKIAAYPFTTLSPQLGVAEIESRGGARRLILADIPGLIEGAAQGAGLGHDFLRHVERTKVLLHLLDAAPLDGSDPAENYRKIRAEIHEYSPLLSEKMEIIALNKLDLIPDEQDRKKAVSDLRKKLKLGGKDEVLLLSGAARMGLRELLEKLWEMLHPKGDVVEGWKAPEATV